MKSKRLKYFLAEKPWVKLTILTTMLITALCGVLLINAVWGNPIK